MADIDLGSPAAISYEWTADSPTYLNRSIDGSLRARVDRVPLFNLKAKLAPMRLDEAAEFTAKVENARGQRRAVLFGFNHPRASAEWKAGNFVAFDNHHKLYRLVEVPDGTGSAPPAGTPPPGWVLFPAPQVLVAGDPTTSPATAAATLSLATRGRFILAEPKFTTDAGNQRVDIVLSLMEAPQYQL